MWRFLCHRQATNTPPPFLFKDGTFCTGSHLNMLLSAWMVPLNLVHIHISSHSFHIGAASTAAAAGLPAWLIQALARWSSQCYTRCIRMFPAIRDILIQDPRSQDSRSKIPKSSSRNQDSEIKIQKSGSQNQDPEIKIPKSRSRNQDLES